MLPATANHVRFINDAAAVKYNTLCTFLSLHGTYTGRACEMGHEIVNQQFYALKKPTTFND